MEEEAVIPPRRRPSPAWVASLGMLVAGRLQTQRGFGDAGGEAASRPVEESYVKD